MKAKLIELGLPDDLVEKILDVFDTNQKMRARHSKPKGQISFQKNLQKIVQLAEKLEGELSRLTLMERQLIDLSCYPKTFHLRGALNRLSMSCSHAQKMNPRFSRKDPFMLDLTVTLWSLLEANGVTVKIYKNNMLCKVLKTLIPLPEPDQNEDVLPDDLWAFHLVREASKRIPRS